MAGPGDPELPWAVSRLFMSEQILASKEQKEGELEGKGIDNNSFHCEAPLPN